MKRFAGLDVSLEEAAVRVVAGAGAMVGEARVPSEQEALVAFFQGSGLVLERSGLEACPLAARLHEGLTAASLPVVCIETCCAEAALGRCRMRPAATTRGIAQIVRAGRCRVVRVKGSACRSRRAPPAVPRLLIDEVRDLENGLRGLLREVGLEVGMPAREEFVARVRELVAADPLLSASPSRRSRSSRPWPASWRGSPGACSSSCGPSRSAAG